MSVLPYLRKVFGAFAIATLVCGSFLMGGVSVFALDDLSALFKASITDVSHVTESSVRLKVEINTDNRENWIDDATVLGFLRENPVEWSSYGVGEIGWVLWIRENVSGADGPEDYLKQFKLQYSKNDDFSGYTEVSLIDGINPSLNLQKIFINIPNLDSNQEYHVRVVADWNSILEYFTTRTPISEVETFTTAKVGEGETPDESLLVSSEEDYLDYLIQSSGLGEDAKCGVIMQGTIPGCFLALSQTIYSVTAGLLGIVGDVFDSFAAFSISSPIYRDITFINIGWKLIRDLSNLVFIFALVVAAIQLILGNSTSTAKTIKYVIVIALLINFSLFICRVVIDGGNILARVFYNNISVTQGDTLDSTPVVEGARFDASQGLVEKKSLSLGLARGLSIQNLITQDTIKAMQSSNFFNVYTFILLFVIGIIINATAAWIFIIGALLFVARVVGLWVTMIFAPGAFILYVAPSLQVTIPEANPKMWWKSLFSYAFLAPIFLFFVYLVILLINSNFLQGIFRNQGNEDFIPFILSLVFPFIVIIIILQRGLDVTKGLAGAIGKTIVGGFEKVAGSALGLAGGAVIGGAAIAGRAVGGKLANMALQNENLQELKDKKGLSGWAARRALGTADKVRKSDFDFRSTGMAKGLTDQLGKLGMKVNLDGDSLKSFGLDKASGKGGYEGVADRRKNEQLAFAKMALGEQEKMVKSKTEAEEANRKKEWDGKDAAWKAKYEEDLAKAREIAKQKKINLDEEDFNKNYGKGDPFALRGKYGGKSYIIKNGFEGNKKQDDYVALDAKKVAQEAVKASKQNLADVYASGDNLTSSTKESYNNMIKKARDGNVMGAAASDIAATGTAAGAGLTAAGAASVVGLAPVVGAGGVMYAQGTMIKEGDRRASDALRGESKDSGKALTSLGKLADLLKEAKAGAVTTQGKENDAGAIKEALVVNQQILAELRGQTTTLRKQYYLAKTNEEKGTGSKEETAQAYEKMVNHALKLNDTQTKVKEYTNYEKDKKTHEEKLAGKKPEEKKE